MSTFSARVAVHSEDGSTTWFNPGDDVPDWADGLVGKHCLEPEVEADGPDFTGGSAEGAQNNPEDADSDPADDADNGDDDGEEEGEGKADEGVDVDSAAKTDVPDFTAPAARRGRPRKS